MEEKLVTISFTIQSKQLSQVETLTQRLECSRGWILRDLIRRGLAAYPVSELPEDMDPADRAVVEALARRVE